MGNRSYRRRSSAGAAIAGITLMFTGLFIGCGPKWVLSPLAPAKPPLVADSGMVVAAHPLAAEAGVSVLRDGGNAVDAALAALFMLNVVEPHASGLGGGGFALVRMAEGEAKVVVYREKAPKAVNPAYYADPADSMRLRAKSGGSAVCVPGSAAGWAELLDRWGTMPLERLTRDAIDAADNGFVVDPVLAGQISGNLEKIAADSQLTNTFLKLGALPYEAGDTLRQPLLAATFRTLTERGLRSFYRGPIAEAVMSVTSREGNPMSLEDLEFYRVEVTEPLRVTYRGCELLTVPPPSSGGAALIESLSLFEATNATAPGIGTPESVHLMSQCIQQAYADAAVRVQDGTDPASLSKIWSTEHLKTAAASINVKAKPGAKLPIKDPDTKDVGNTTHLVVVDRFGNAVSLTQSINYFFGAGVMAPGTGLLLNNELADFNLPPDSVNLIAPRARPKSNMAPVIMLKDGKPWLVAGTPGSGRIAAAMAQIIVDMVDYKLDISSAIDYPRFFPDQNHLVAESRFGFDALKRLRKTGYIIHLAGPYHNYFGGAHGIIVNLSDGKLYGAADRRRGGAPRGY